MLLVCAINVSVKYMRADMSAFISVRAMWRPWRRRRVLLYYLYVIVVSIVLFVLFIVMLWI